MRLKKSVLSILSIAAVAFTPRFAWSDTADFYVTDLPTSIGIYDTVEYLALASGGLMLANGRDNQTGQRSSLLVQSDGTNLRELATSDELKEAFIGGVMNQGGVGYIYDLIDKNNIYSAYSFDNTGAGQEFTITVEDGVSFFAIGVNDDGKLLASVGTEGGPFKHVLVSPDGTITDLPSDLSALGLSAIGPGAILGFTTYIANAPYSTAPSILFNSNNNIQEQIADAEIAAIDSPSRLWLKDTSKNLLWLRDSGNDSRKIKFSTGNLHSTSDGGAFGGETYVSHGPTYITPTLKKKAITCAFPAGAISRKYYRIVSVNQNQALVSFSEIKGSKVINDGGAALVTYNPSGNNKNYCTNNVELVKSGKCKLKTLAPNYYEISEKSIKSCEIELSLFGALAKGSTPVTLSMQTTSGYKNKTFRASNGRLKITLPVSPKIFQYSIGAPRDGFRKLHSAEIFIVPHR